MERFDHAILGVERITLGPGEKADRRGVKGEAECLGEAGIGVSQEREACRAGPGRFAPCLHHEGIVDRNADDVFDALGRESIFRADEAGHMGRMAGGREGAGDPEDHNLAAFGQRGDGDLFGTISAHTDQGGFGQRLACGNRHASSLVSLRFR